MDASIYSHPKMGRDPVPVPYRTPRLQMRQQAYACLFVKRILGDN